MQSTARNLDLIREVRARRGEDAGWIKTIEDALQRTADALRGGARKAESAVPKAQQPAGPVQGKAAKRAKTKKRAKAKKATAKYAKKKSAKKKSAKKTDDAAPEGGEA